MCCVYYTHSITLRLTRCSNEYDQELDSVLVGPLPVGVNKFVFRADPPDLSRIPNSEIIGVTVILLSCSYEDREFVRVGYYVNNEYVDEALALEPPAKPVIEKVQRQILAEKPRVTRFAIKWYVMLRANNECTRLTSNRDSEESAPPEFPPEQPEADLNADGDQYGIEEEDEEMEMDDGEANAANGDKRTQQQPGSVQQQHGADVMVH
jgi:histone chaperone ASF1